jgi:hypothetical protein
MNRPMWTDGGDVFDIDGLPPVAHRHICHLGGGGDSGGTMQTSKSNGEQVTGPNPYLAPQLQKISNAAFDWTDQNMTMPGYFPGGTVAAQSPGTVSGLETLFQRGGGGYNKTQPGYDFVSDTLGGKYLTPESNPAYQGWLEASFRPQAEQFRDIIAPSMDSKFAGSGRTAGGAHFDTSMRGYQDLARSQSDAAAKSALGLYQGERANQFQALGALPGLQNMDYQNIQAMLQAGAGSDAYAQSRLDDANAKYSYDKGGQLDWYNKLSQSLQGMYPGGQQIGWQTGMGQGGGGGGGGGGQGLQLAGAGIAAAGTIAAAFI